MAMERFLCVPCINGGALGRGPIPDTPPWPHLGQQKCPYMQAREQPLREHDCVNAIGLLYTRVPSAYTGASAQHPVHPACPGQPALERSKRTFHLVIFFCSSSRDHSKCKFKIPSRDLMSL